MSAMTHDCIVLTNYYNKQPQIDYHNCAGIVRAQTKTAQAICFHTIMTASKPIHNT